MDEHTLSKEKMDAMRALADTNMEIGVAKNTLIKLQEQETSYLEEREKKVMIRIQKILDDSKDLLAEAQSNYSQIRELHGTVSSFTEFLKEAYQAFLGLLKDFRERNDAWDNKVSEIETGFENLKRQINTDKVRIKNDTETLERAKAQMLIERRKIDDDRGELDRAIKRLKQGKV